MLRETTATVHERLNRDRARVAAMAALAGDQQFAVMTTQDRPVRSTLEQGECIRDPA